MRATFSTIAVFCAALMALSCAKQEELSYNTIEQNALDEWIKVNVPGAQKLTKGIYYEVITANPGGKAVEPGSWVEVDYQVLDMEGNIVYARQETTLSKLGTYSRYTHYVPDYFLIEETVSKSSSLGIINAQYYALTQMKEGETWRLYTPSRHIFNGAGLTNSIGYGGQYSLESGKPAIIENLSVVKVIDDPDVYEQEQVETVARGTGNGNWGLNLRDTVSNTSRYFARQFLSRGLLKDTIRIDSTARIYYVGKFLDGFIFDTNVDTVWANNFGYKRYDSSSKKLIDDTTAVSLTLAKDMQVSTSMPNKVFTLVLLEDREEMKLRYGDSVRVVLTSPYAYETTGRQGYKSSGSDYSYNYNPYYYQYGGYGYYSPYSSYYNYYDTSSASSTIYPIAEIKPYTPVIYEFVVKRPAGSSGDEEG